MKVPVDMNLSPVWVDVLLSAGFEAVHWSAVGDPRASAATLMAWAKENGHIVFTHDLDFGTLLALTQAEGPSVRQVRAQDIAPTALGPMVGVALRQFEDELGRGALVTVDPARARVRVLPFDEGPR